MSERLETKRCIQALYKYSPFLSFSFPLLTPNYGVKHYVTQGYKADAPHTKPTALVYGNICLHSAVTKINSHFTNLSLSFIIQRRFLHG